MGAELTFVRVSFGAIFLSAFTAVSVAVSCPSSAVIYASEGDNVTICWKLLQEAKSNDLKSITVKTLYRPVEEEMRAVASADGKGIDKPVSKHDGLYKGKATLNADLQGNTLLFKIVNYTIMMENVYCSFYEMTGSKSKVIQTCHTEAVLLRNFADQQYTTNIPSTETTVMTVKAPATKGERASSPQNYKIAFIIVVSVTGVLCVLTVVAFALYCRARLKSP